MFARPRGIAFLWTKHPCGAKRINCDVFWVQTNIICCLFFRDTESIGSQLENPEQSGPNKTHTVDLLSGETLPNLLVNMLESSRRSKLGLTKVQYIDECSMFFFWLSEFTGPWEQCCGCNVNLIERTPTISPTQNCLCIKHSYNFMLTSLCKSAHLGRIRKACIYWNVLEEYPLKRCLLSYSQLPFRASRSVVATWYLFQYDTQSNGAV